MVLPSLTDSSAAVIAVNHDSSIVTSAHPPLSPSRILWCQTEICLLFVPTFTYLELKKKATLLSSL